VNKLTTPFNYILLTRSLQIFVRC